MVLYHAISTYQILEVILHRMKYHKDEKSVLILPDFITNKHDNYQVLVQSDLFDEVYLFPYLQIPHDEFFIQSNIERIYEEHVPYTLEEFSEIYVAGVHFFFSVLLIKKKIGFIAFEDASRMVTKGWKIYDELMIQFPAHAKIAADYGLFDFQTDCIKGIVVQRKSRKVRKYQITFNVERELKKMNDEEFNKLLVFFRLTISENDIMKKDLLLTERFSVIGKITEREQIELYIYLVDNYFDEKRLIIKPHPDERISYADFFPGAIIFPASCPSELLVRILGKKIRCVYTFNSTAINSMGRNSRTKRFDFNKIMEEKNESNRCNSSKI